MEGMLTALKYQGLSWPVMVLGFVLCFVFAALLKRQYIAHSRKIALDLDSNLLPFLSLVTFLVVIVIQDSLMLSLGMVGALSIVRFRSPIKNAMDLGYLFFSVAIGIAFASGKLMVALIIVGLLFLILNYLVNSSLLDFENADKTQAYDSYSVVVDLSQSVKSFSDAALVIEKFNPKSFMLREQVLEMHINSGLYDLSEIESVLKEVINLKILSITAY